MVVDITTEGSIFIVMGHDVRIEGLRFQGPMTTYTDTERESDRDVRAFWWMRE